MTLQDYEVKKGDTVLSICHTFNITIKQLVDLNIGKYSGLKNNPYMIFYGWHLRVPFTQNGGNTQYDIYSGEVIT